MTAVRTCALLLAACFSSAARAQPMPVGGEFQVNTYTTNEQFGPAVAITDVDGDFVVVWTSYGQDGSGGAVMGRRYTPDGLPAGAEFQVNTYTDGSQRLPAVAADGAGGFVVAWESSNDYGSGPGQDGSSSGIFGQRFASNGTHVGPEFQVNTYTTGPQSNAVVAADAAGKFVVAWQGGGYYGTTKDGSASGLLVRWCDRGGYWSGIAAKLKRE